MINTNAESLNINVQEYKKYSYQKYSKIHQMTAYLAMFPPSLPYYFITKFTDKNDIVYDPFSGRGTTPFEACRLGRIGIGNDLNPLAVCLTKAKINLPLVPNMLFSRITELENYYKFINISGISEDIRMLYDEDTTLPQLLYLKNTLNRKNKIDNFILAILTGLMHGKHRKDGTSIYCSIDMPNTFSMSPNYVKNFIENNNLIKLKQNVFTLIRNRISNIYISELNNTKYANDPLKSLHNYKTGKCYQTDAIKSSGKIIANHGKNKVKLIVTSPPYLKVINYGKYNWIRLWLLDEQTEIIDKKLSAYQTTQIQKLNDNMGLYDYALYMQKLFNSWYDILTEDGYAFVVIGDVNEWKGRYINLAAETWKIIKINGGCNLKLVDIISDDLRDKGDIKVTKIWGNKKGHATEIDRIMVLRRGD